MTIAQTSYPRSYARCLGTLPRGAAALARREGAARAAGCRRRGRGALPRRRRRRDPVHRRVGSRAGWLGRRRPGQVSIELVLVVIHERMMFLFMMAFSWMIRMRSAHSSYATTGLKRSMFFLPSSIQIISTGAAVSSALRWTARTL